MNWQDYPKTELHLHIEGAAPTAFILKKAAQKNIDLGGYVDGSHYVWQDFASFLKVYEAVTAVLETPEDYYDLTRAVLADQAANGVIYTEMFLGAALMCDNDPVLWSEMLAAIETASDELEEDGIYARFITVAVRHFGAKRAQDTAALATKHRTARMRGFGMAGAEDFGRPSDFAPAFECAREAGLGLTCHAGEWRDPPAIRETIEALGVTRLGHGVRAAQSRDLIDLIKARDVHCEICPGSNIAFGIYGDWRDHPITMMRDNGVSFSMSTDDPPYFHTNMTHEYERLAAIGWQVDDFAHSNQEAMRHAFCEDALREKLIRNWSDHADNL